MTASPSSARSEILSRIRSALDGNGGSGRRPQSELADAISQRAARVRPPLGGEPVAVFKAKAEANLISVRELQSLDAVPEAVSAILAGSNMPPDISVSPALTQLAWPKTFTLNSGKARIDEKLTVSLALAAIAETGSLVLCSGESAPSSLTHAAEQHVIVLRRADIAAYLEDGLGRVKTRGEPWPRAVNLVSGPSRTADVAGIVVRPAHGPKAVHLLLVD